MSAVWQVQPLAAPQRQALEPLLRENWGGPLIASRGRLLDARQLPGLWVGETGNLLGYLLYHPEGDQWEVALLEALEQGRGVGSALLGAVEELARRRGCKRLWLVTTNDNTHALAFYQRRGFVLAALHRDAVTEARKTLKPSLPLVCSGRDTWPAKPWAGGVCVFSRHRPAFGFSRGLSGDGEKPCPVMVLEAGAGVFRM